MKFRANKYGNIPTRSRHTGRMFQSKKEANREPVLLALQNAGEISALSYQVPYSLEVYSTQAVEELIRCMADDVVQGRLELTNELKRRVDGVLVSRHKLCRYLSDFDYLDKQGNHVTEDIKGYRTDVYKLKKKLMLACHGIEIQEPNIGGVQQRARGAGVRGVGTGSRFKGNR